MNPTAIGTNTQTTEVKSAKGANILKKKFRVLNMNCAACASSSQTMLENTPGVLRASVNYANSGSNGEHQELPIASVQIGNSLLVKPGQKIPVNGAVR